MNVETLHIQLLGGFHVRTNSSSIPDDQWRSKRARSLVKLLALAQAQRLHRDQVLDALWPDSDLNAAANNLHQTLFTARKIFESAGASALTLQDGLLSLRDQVSVDVEQFEEAAANALKSSDPALFQAALDLYSGDLLPEDLYEEWTLARRDTLRQLRLKLLLELARLHESRQEQTAGIETLGQVLSIDRAHEEAHAGLMRLYALNGQRQQALRQFQTLREALQAELETEPGKETLQLYQTILSGRFSSQKSAAFPQASTALPLPAGTVTFLFTDIEGSTPLWEKQPQAMRAAVVRHHAILQDAITENDGVVFKIIGDAFQAVFLNAHQGIAAALAAQQALQAENWPKEMGNLRVRMGVHSGPAELAGDDYAVSHTLNRAARVMSAGFGGQILLSQESASLVARDLSAGVDIRDLGEHRLKGMQIPEHLYQVSAPGLLSSFPPLPSAIAHIHNLPAQLTSFIGREIEIGELIPKVKAMRLITLTGSGGTGKTRLALQVAVGVLESFPDGVWLVELAPLSDPELVPQACLQALDLVQQPGTAPATTLVHYLANKQSLLLLDNCEHILAACTSLVNALLKGCPQLHILATSREILSIPGENSMRVPSLASPDPRSLPPLEELSQFEAVRLFVERSVQVSPTFQLTMENAAPAVTICNRLDGIPLAIELAAARMHVMTVAQIASRLDNTFRILTGGSKAVLPRQQTLKATIDWSYDLLSPQERRLLQRLSVFAGGWTLEAAEAVCADEGEAENSLSALDVMDVLTQLVDKSLAIASIQAGGARYHLLETIRQYARDRLMETGLGVEVRVRHLAYFAQLSAEAQPHLRATGMVEWLERLDQELDNLRVALEWALTSDIVAGLKIVTDLFWFWHFRALFEEEVAHLEKLLAAEAAQRGAGPLVGERALQRARALRTLADQLNYTNHPLAVHVQTYLQESVAILRGLGPAARSELGFSLLTLWWRQGDNDTPSPLPAEFLEIFEGEKNAFNLSEYYYFRSFIESDRGRLEEAEAFNEKSLAISRELGDLSGFESRCYNLSFFAWYKGDHARADALLQEALAASRKVKNRWFEPRLRVELSKRALSRGEHPEAARLAEESLLAFRELNYLIGVDDTLDTLQCIAWSRGELEESLRFGRERLELYAGQLFSPLTVFQRNNQIGAHLYLGRVAISQGDLVQAEGLVKISTAHIAENVVSMDYYREIRQLLAWIALLSQQKKAQDAARLFGAVDSFYRRIAPSFSPRERSEFNENLASTRAALGEDGFAQAFALGQALSLEQAIGWVADEMQSHI